MIRFTWRILCTILLGMAMAAHPSGSLSAPEPIDIDLGGSAASAKPAPTKEPIPSTRTEKTTAPAAKPAAKAKANPASTGKAVLQEIAVMDEGEETRVELTGVSLSEPKMRRIPEDPVKKLPNRYVLDFTKTTNSAVKPSGAGLVSQVRTGSPNPGTVRVVAEAPNALEGRLETIEKGFALVLYSKKGAGAGAEASAGEEAAVYKEPASAKGGKTESAKTASKSPVEKSLFNRLIGLSLKQTETGLKVVLTADGPVKYTVRKLARPEKLVMRLHGTKLDIKEKNLLIKKGEPALEKGGLLMMESREIGSRLAPISEVILTLQPRTVHQIAQDLNQVVITLNAPGEEREVEKTGNFNQKVTVDLEGADLNTVLKTLGTEAGFDVDLLEGVTGTVHQRLKDVPFKHALAVLLSPNNYNYEVQGNILRIGTDTQLRSTKAIMPQVVEILYPGNLLPGTLDALVRSVMPRSNAVTSVYDPTRNAIILKGTPSDLEQYKRTIHDLKLDSNESDRITRIAKLNYADPTAIRNILSPYLTPQGSIQLDTRNQSLVIWEAASNMGVLLELIKELDVRLPQVLIESSIVEVSTERASSLGLTWSAAKTGGDPTLDTTAALSPTDYAGSMVFGTVRGGFDIRATLRALETSNDGKVISRPRVATASGVSASIQTTETVVYSNTTETITDGVHTFTTTYIQLPLPISLNVTPRITDDGRITTQIVANIVSVAGAAVGNAPPPTTQQNAQTTITVKNGDTIVIGGLVRDTAQERIRRIPLLGSLPILGSLFRSKDVSSRKTELIIFITPTLLED